MREVTSFRVDDQLPNAELQALLTQTDYPTVWLDTFLRSTVSAGHSPVLFRLDRDGELVGLALGMFRPGRFASHLLLPTNPRMLRDDALLLPQFWQGIRDFCYSHGLVRLTIQSYESPESFTPPFERMTACQERSEYYIDLQPDMEAIRAGCSSSHRRNVRKGEKADLECRLLSGNEAIGGLDDHLAAFAGTADRRRDRGESIPGVNARLLRQLLESGDAFIMQLFRDASVISSIFLIITPSSAFYFSGGTTPEGTRIGAFHYLMIRAIEELKSRGIRSLTLGGTDAETPEGLRRFKLGFGAKEVELAHREYLEGSASKAFVYRTQQTLRADPMALPRAIGGRVHRTLERICRFNRWHLYMHQSGDAAIAIAPDETLELRPLETEDYQQMLAAEGRLGNQARLYYRDRGISCAYGVFIKGTLAHICWAYTPEDYRREPTTQLQLAPTEVELTNAYTLEQFRGQRLFSYAIAQLSDMLASQGKTAIYTKVDPSNEASRRAIERGGHRQCGQVWQFYLPFLRAWRGVSFKMPL